MARAAAAAASTAAAAVVVSLLPQRVVMDVPAYSALAVTAVELALYAVVPPEVLTAEAEAEAVTSAAVVV